MTTMKCDYTELTNWIYSNPRIRTINHFADTIKESRQRITYSIKVGSFFNEKVIKKIVSIYNLTEEQKNTFFYTIK